MKEGETTILRLLSLITLSFRSFLPWKKIFPVTLKGVIKVIFLGHQVGNDTALVLITPSLRAAV